MKACDVHRWLSTKLKSSFVIKALVFYILQRTVCIPPHFYDPEPRRNRLLDAENLESSIRVFKQLHPITQVSFLAVVDLKHSHIEVSAM